MLATILGIVNFLITAAIGLYILFAKSYVDQKGKDLATKEDIGEITEKIEKVKASIQEDYNHRLERLKSELKIHEATISSALAAQTKGSDAVMKETIEAVKVFWEQWLNMRQAIARIEWHDSYLHEKEFNSLFTEQWKGNNILPNEFINMDFSNPINAVTNAYEQVEKKRAFLSMSERLWTYLSFQRLFIGRILYIYKQGVSQRKLTHWKTEVSLLDQVKGVLSQEEYTYVKESPYGTIGAVQEYLVQKVLLETSELLMGKAVAVSTFKQATELIKLNQENSKTMQESNLS